MLPPLSGPFLCCCFARFICYEAGMALLTTNPVHAWQAGGPHVRQAGASGDQLGGGLGRGGQFRDGGQARPLRFCAVEGRQVWRARLAPRPSARAAPTAPWAPAGQVCGFFQLLQSTEFSEGIALRWAGR